MLGIEAKPLFEVGKGHELTQLLFIEGLGDKAGIQSHQKYQNNPKTPL